MASALVTLFSSVLLETFLFRPLVKAAPDLFPWNRELNAVSLVLSSIIGGLVGVRLAQSSASLAVALPAKLRDMLARFKEERSPLLLIGCAGGVVALLWLLRGTVVGNPLTVGWRGYLMNGAGAACGGSLWIGRRARRVMSPGLLVALGLGFGTVVYDSYAFEVIIPADRVLLRGELTVPGRHADATYPAVLLVADWGCQSANETGAVNSVFRGIAAHLVRSGYAVLRYDQRGCGRSSGNMAQSGLQDWAGDVAAAGAFLAGRQEMGGQPIYAVGHGYGGQAVTIAAQREPGLFAGLALLATPASPVSELLRHQQQYKLSALGASQAEGDARLAAVNQWLEAVRTRRYLNYGDYFASNGLPEELQADQLAIPMPPVWLREAMDHDQRIALAALPVPVLILAGEADWQVPPSEAEALAEALSAAGRSDWELHLLPGVNHQLVAVESMEASLQLEQTDAFKKGRRPVDPQVPAALIDWLDRREQTQGE